MSVKINSSSLTGVSIRASSTQSQRTKASSGSISPLMRDQLSFKEIDLEEYGGVGIGVASECHDALKAVLVRLFTDILNYGIVIVSRRPRDYGSYVVEASFKAADKNSSIHQMMLPLRGTANGDKFASEVGVSSIERENQQSKQIAQHLVERVTTSGNRGDVIKLISVTAHEFGHFLSWLAGNHNKELREGLEMSNTSGVIRYGFEKTFAVYREEILAWNFGRSKLLLYKFAFLDVYDQTRDNSLATYYKQLNLQGAPVGIHARMSLYSSYDNRKIVNKR